MKTAHSFFTKQSVPLMVSLRFRFTDGSRNIYFSSLHGNFYHYCYFFLNEVSSKLLKVLITMDANLVRGDIGSGSFSAEERTRFKNGIFSSGQRSQSVLSKMAQYRTANFERYFRAHFFP